MAVFCCVVGGGGRFKAAEKRLIKLQRQLDQFDLKHGAKQSDDCVAAFVVFNCEDSQRFCVIDYANSDTWRRVFQVCALCVCACVCVGVGGWVGGGGEAR